MSILDQYYDGDQACDALKHFIEQWRGTKRIRRIIFSINGQDVQLYVRAHEKAFIEGDKKDAAVKQEPETELIIDPPQNPDFPLEPFDQFGNPLP